MFLIEKAANILDSVCAVSLDQRALIKLCSDFDIETRTSDCCSILINSTGKSLTNHVGIWMFLIRTATKVQSTQSHAAKLIINTRHRRASRSTGQTNESIVRTVGQTDRETIVRSFGQSDWRSYGRMNARDRRSDGADERTEWRTTGVWQSIGWTCSDRQTVRSDRCAWRSVSRTDVWRGGRTVGWSEGSTNDRLDTCSADQTVPHNYPSSDILSESKKISTSSYG